VASRLVKLVGVGVELAGQLLVTAGDKPDLMRNEAALTKLRFGTLTR
jgi:transposase